MCGRWLSWQSYWIIATCLIWFDHQIIIIYDLTTDAQNVTTTTTAAYLMAIIQDDPGEPVPEKSSIITHN